MAFPTKEYGLLLPQKKGTSKTAILQKPSVFGDDSDDETSVGESLQREAVKKKMMKQTRLEMQKALEQDSTVYDYDAVYDDIQNQRLENTKKSLHGTDKRPKYIHQLMRAVEDRKKEQERRDERKIQKEREAEGEQFADKEAYVTTAYKQKLLEQKEEQEQEKREAAMEAALDVKKQKDLSGFYRHLLNQAVGEEAIPDRSANKIQPSKILNDTERTSPSSEFHDNIPSSCSDNDDRKEQKSGFIKPVMGSAHSKRQYRQRSPSSGSGEEKEKERERERHKKRHRDQDRDRGKDRDRDRERDRDRHRGRERDDRHGGRRDDRDRKKERDRDRDDRSRSKGETERENRRGKRERSPKERERDKSGEREKRRNPAEDEQKNKEREEEMEKSKEPEKKEEMVKREEEEPEKKEQSEEKEDEPRPRGEQKEETEQKANKFAKRSTDQAVSSARDRYMARQVCRSASKSYIEKEED